MRGSSSGILGLILVALVTRAGASVSAQPPAPSTPPPDKDAPIEVEFRVFDADDEVTAESSVRIFPTGSREEGITLEPSNGRLAIHIPAATYDVRVIRLKQGQVSSIRWTERLVVMNYPGESGHHLEVINFRPRYGALQVVSRDGSDFELTAMMPGVRDVASEKRQVGRIVKGVGYQMFVAPAGRYDVRIRTGSGDSENERWLLDIEVPADRTRLKTTDGS